jgi:hypothetical protein
MKIGMSVMTEEPAFRLYQIGTPQFEKADFLIDRLSSKVYAVVLVMFF